MKRLCFASIFNALCKAKRDGFGETQIFSAIWTALDKSGYFADDDDTPKKESDEERGKYFVPSHISKIKSGVRSFPNSSSKNIKTTTYEEFKEEVRKNLIPLLREQLTEEVGLTIKDIILSDTSISNDAIFYNKEPSSTKENVVRYKDLSALIVASLHYSITNVKNSVYKDSKTDKINSLINSNDFYEKYPKLKEKVYKQDPNDHGIRDSFLVIDDINYKDLFTSAKNIDIVHIHGMTWTNKNRKAIINRLRDTETVIRVVLLSSESEFMPPYEHFIGEESPYLSYKLKEILKTTWEGIYSEASYKRTKPVGKLLVYLGDFFPSKSLYRFDNSIIVNPSYMTRQKQDNLPTIRCDLTELNSKSFYETYLNEINEIIEDALCIDASEKTVCYENFFN